MQVSKHKLTTVLLKSEPNTEVAPFKNWNLQENLLVRLIYLQFLVTAASGEWQRVSLRQVDANTRETL